MLFKPLTIKRLSAVCLLICTLLAIGVAYWFQHPHNNPKTVVLIERGASLSRIATQLSDHDVLTFPLFFRAILLCTGEWRQLKAGEYSIPPHATPAQLLRILKTGDVVLHPVTLTEGETSHRLVQKLTQDLRFQGVCSIPPEGSLLPETYHFPRGTQRQAILIRMQKEMKATLSNLWAKRPPNCPLQTPEELVILASIVEKETALPQERPMVAAVFLNRLKSNMPLQADPTIVYALTRGAEVLGRALTRDDLRVDSPHNTYLHAGLPPSPIANPGLSSLKAVLNPTDVPYLYFVADGSGGHVFATTLEEHQHNHEAWRKIRAERKKEE